jgi:DNA-binding MarR family transcriptional regulator
MDRKAHDDALRGVEEAVGYLVGSMRARWKDLAHQLHPDLQPMGFRIITTLVSAGPLRSKDLAAKLGTDKSVMSRQLSQLEKFGLVERHVDPDDGRIIHMAVTEATTRKLRTMGSGTNSPRVQALNAWPTERLRDFAEMLNDFTENRAPST